MSDRKHPYTPMQRTNYGYVSKEEQQIDKQLDRDLKRRLRKEDAFNWHKKTQPQLGKGSGKKF